jgi:two-component system sensor kinase FixL
MATMKTSKHKITKAKTVPIRVLKKKETRSAERIRFQGRVNDLSKSRDALGKKVIRQTDQLLVRKGQLIKGAVKQKRSDEQVHIRTKAMEATSDGIFIMEARNGDFPVIYANQAFYVMTGYRKKEIIGENYFHLYGADADPRTIEDIKQTMRQGKSFHGEVLHSTKNGEKYWNLLRITPVRDDQATITHYVGLQTDVTLMRRRDLEIKEQREQLLHVTRVGKMAEFVSSLAHEISQPLTAILSYAQAAQRMLANREPQLKEILQYIINDDQRAAEVIRRLRALLKKSEPEMKPLDMNVLIQETVMLIATDATVRNNIIRTDLNARLPIFQGDRIQLQQVLLNLISNSFDAMEDSPDAHEMMIRTWCKDPETIMVEVKDSGSGVSEQNLSKLFVHFFTSKPDGLGMGLSISRSIVEAHGGRLDVRNNSNRGATFYFTVPVDKKETHA